MLQRSRCTKGSVRASWSARCTHQCNSSWQLCSTNACWNKGGNLWDIREGAKEFKHLPLPLLTALKQIFSESETTESRCFVLPRCWELFALFPKAAEETLIQVGRFLVWMEPVHPYKMRARPGGDQCQGYFTLWMKDHHHYDEGLEVHLAVQSTYTDLTLDVAFSALVWASFPVVIFTVL